MAIRCKSLQGLQQHRGGHEGSPDHERPRPSEAEHQRETEIAGDMVDLPTETRTILPFRRAKGAEYEQQDQDGHVANSCRRFKRHFRAPQNAWVNQRSRATLLDFSAHAVTRKQQWALKTGSNSTAKDSAAPWRFAGSDRGGARAAVLFTLIQTAWLNDVDP
jgi:hypothetical protein